MRYLSFVLATAALLIHPVAAGLMAFEEPDPEPVPVICHGTSSDTRPYIKRGGKYAAQHMSAKHNQNKKYHDEYPGAQVTVLGKEYILDQDCHLVEVFPSSSPSQAPTTATPTDEPTHSPTKGPTLSPTSDPTALPTNSPTHSPTKSPTLSPTSRPTNSPTHSPTKSPTWYPIDEIDTWAPTSDPTSWPTNSPTHSPTKSPTWTPIAVFDFTDSPTWTIGSETLSPTKPRATPDPFVGKQDCQQLGYDFGFQMEMCIWSKERQIDSLDQTPFRKGVDQAKCQVSNVGDLDLVCSDRDMNHGGLFREATITPSVDTSVIVQGNSGGNLYKDLVAGSTYTLNAGTVYGNPSEPITFIEFCIKCNQNKTTDRRGSSFGDPHIKTWGGGHFDFHGGCDLILLDSPNYSKGLGCRIHIRTRITDWWSYIDSAVIQIGNDRLEVKGIKETHKVQYWTNGKLGPDLADGQYLKNFTLGGRKVQYHDKSLKTKTFQMKDFSIETFGDWVRVNVRAKHGRDFEGAFGLMGSYPSGSKIGREGQILWNKNKFGMEWQVHMDEPKLFHNQEGVQHPQQCEMPYTMKRTSLRHRRLGEALSKSDAALACGHVEKEYILDCMADVLATNDKGMAAAYY